MAWPTAAILAASCKQRFKVSQSTDLVTHVMLPDQVHTAIYTVPSYQCLVIGKYLHTQLCFIPMLPAPSIVIELIICLCECAGGFASFPTLGMKALGNTWNFDFQQTYVGAGMICPLIVDWSIMLGSIACYVSCPTSSSPTLPHCGVGCLHLCARLVMQVGMSVRASMSHLWLLLLCSCLGLPSAGLARSCPMPHKVPCPAPQPCQAP